MRRPRMGAESVERLIGFVRAHSQASFYRNVWGKAHVFEELPTISRDDISRTPPSERRYKNERGLVKIVQDTANPFSSEWSLEDIGKEVYGVISKRPMVYFADACEALEKSLWCYTHDMLPLIGELDPDLATFSATKYDIDSLITDTESLLKLSKYLESLKKPLTGITVIGDVFKPQDILPFTRFASRIRLLLALPEVGGFADAELSMHPTFNLLPNCIVEEEESFVVVTKLTALVTPIIRYRTHIPYSQLSTTL